MCIVCNPDSGENCGENVDSNTVTTVWVPASGAGFSVPIVAGIATPNVDESKCETGPEVQCKDIESTTEQATAFFKCCNRSGATLLGPLHTCHEYVNNCLCQAGVKKPPHFPKIHWQTVMLFED